MTAPEMPTLSGATISQRNDGSWVGEYLNRRVISIDRNRVMAYLRVVQLEEQGMLQNQAIEQAMSEYPYDLNTGVQVIWDTVKPAEKTIEGVPVVEEHTLLGPKGELM